MSSQALPVFPSIPSPPSRTKSWEQQEAAFLLVDKGLKALSWNGTSPRLGPHLALLLLWGLCFGWGQGTSQVLFEAEGVESLSLGLLFWPLLLLGVVRPDALAFWGTLPCPYRGQKIAYTSTKLSPSQTGRASIWWEPGWEAG